MDAASQPTLKQLISQNQEESEAKKDLEKVLESYGEQLPLADPYGVNPRKAHISEVLPIFQAFTSEMCKIRRRTTSDVNAAANYVYKAVMDFCRVTGSSVAIHQLPHDPVFREEIRAAIRASMFGSGSAIQREPRAKQSGAASTRGRRPDRERRDAIRSAVRKYGAGWRDHLSEIFRELDSVEASLGDFQALKIDLGDGQSRQVSSWDDLDLAQGAQRRQIVDTLRKYAD